MEAEIEAIVHVLSLVFASRLKGFSTVICSDSSLAINAIYEGLEHSFPLLAPPFNIQALLEESIQLNYIPSVLNEEADELAKSGVNREVFSFFGTRHYSSTIVQKVSQASKH